MAEAKKEPKEQSLAERKSSKSVYEQVKEAETEKLEMSERVKKAGQSVYRQILYYSLPLLSIGVFLGIIIFGVVPSVKGGSGRKGILNHIDENEEKLEEVGELDAELTLLKDLSSREYQLDRDLAIVDKIVPSEKTQVAKFVGEIEELAKEHDLEEYGYESGEEVRRLEEEEEVIEEETEETASIINIPTESEYVATFTNIENFLNALYNKDDFIIVKELELQGYEAREYFASQQRDRGDRITIDTTLSYSSWTMNVTFEKYQFSSGFAEYLETSSIPITAEPDEITLGFIRERFGS